MSNMVIMRRLPASASLKHKNIQNMCKTKTYSRTCPQILTRCSKTWKRSPGLGTHLWMAPQLYLVAPLVCQTDWYMSRPKSVFTLSMSHRNLATRALSYYDVLGITPKATHTQVKAAYYKLSKMYHPDINDAPDAQAKFTDILAAYEVLGNKQKRRLYDRGMLNPTDVRSGHKASVETDLTEEELWNMFRPQQGFAKRGPAPTGRSNIYNFDTFYKEHYGDSMNKKQEEKERMAKSEVDDATELAKKRLAKLLYFGSLSIFTVFVAVGRVLKKF